jgi:hypothetical protein
VQGKLPGAWPNETDEILSGNNNGEVTYAPGAAPVRVQVFNPLTVKDGTYILEFVDRIPQVILYQQKPDGSFIMRMIHPKCIQMKNLCFN